MTQQRKDQRLNQERSKSRSREPQRQEAHQEGINQWELGEQIEKRRKQAMSMLVAARKELADMGRVTEELKRGLETIKQQYEATDATKQIAEFLETLPYLERTNELREKIYKEQQQENQRRLEKGDIRSI